MTKIMTTSESWCPPTWTDILWLRAWKARFSAINSVMHDCGRKSQTAQEEDPGDPDDVRAKPPSFSAKSQIPLARHQQAGKPAKWLCGVAS
jgi:hypothetical protein